MSPIRRFFGFLVLGLSGLWWATDSTEWGEQAGLLAWRGPLLQYTGVLGIGVMSVAMVLAVRPVWFESPLGGLDKMYRLHKWLGIAGLVLAVSHWLLARGPQWAVRWGWLERPARARRPLLPEGGLQEWLSSQHGVAEEVGRWAFYAATLLIVLALIRRFPYRYFVKTHRLLAVAYLMLVAHSVALLRFDDWTGWLGPVMGVLMLAGTVSAILVLVGRVAGPRALMGEVVGVRQHPDLDVLEVEILLEGRWAGHEAGQFAFLTLHEEEGAHPFTISTDWRHDGRLTFLIKGLGDYTHTLASRTRPGDTAKVEGPYGRFDFHGTRGRQIWVGAGIGITPFVARMRALSQAGGAEGIDLFHTTKIFDPEAIELLENDARDAGVALHVLWDQRDGLLTAARVVRQVPDWRDADLWFCGPARFDESLRKDLVAMGMPRARFHQELFELR